MFKNRELRIKVAKDEKKNEREIPMKEDRFPIYKDAAKKAFIGVTLAVYGYVIVDTYRQKTVAEAVYRKD